MIALVIVTFGLMVYARTVTAAAPAASLDARNEKPAQQVLRGLDSWEMTNAENLVRSVAHEVVGRVTNSLSSFEHVVEHALSAQDVAVVILTLEPLVIVPDEGRASFRLADFSLRPNARAPHAPQVVVVNSELVSELFSELAIAQLRHRVPGVVGPQRCHLHVIRRHRQCPCSSVVVGAWFIQHRPVEAADLVPCCMTSEV